VEEVEQKRRREESEIDEEIHLKIKSKEKKQGKQRENNYIVGSTKMRSRGEYRYNTEVSRESVEVLSKKLYNNGEKNTRLITPRPYY